MQDLSQNSLISFSSNSEMISTCETSLSDVQIEIEKQEKRKIKKKRDGNLRSNLNDQKKRQGQGKDKSILTLSLEQIMEKEYSKFFTSYIFSQNHYLMTQNY